MMQLTAVLGLAAAAQAFLLVPGLTEPSAETVKALNFRPPRVAERQTLELSCPGCPLTLRRPDGSVRVKADKPSHLMLGFAIETDEDASSRRDRLTVNGFDLYPAAVDHFAQTLRAHHLPDRRPKKIELTRFDAPTLGYSLRVGPLARDEETDLDLIGIDLQIIEVGNTFVHGIPNVRIKLIKTADGKLMIGGIETTESKNPGPSGDRTNPMDKQEECATMLCKWTAIFEDKLSQLRPFKHCGGRKGGVAMTEESHKPVGGLHRHPHQHHHHHGHSKHRQHSWSQLFKNIASHILLPVLIGIMAGVACSLVGMVVGTCIVGFWRAFFRRSHPRSAGRAAHKALKKEASFAEEKTGLMEHQDPPPLYQDEDTASPTGA